MKKKKLTMEPMAIFNTRAKIIGEKVSREKFKLECKKIGKFLKYSRKVYEYFQKLECEKFFFKSLNKFGLALLKFVI